MARPPTPFPIIVAQGGKLVTQPSLSLENVPPTGYCQKTNWRRVTKDQEGRREGWVKFQPGGTGIANQYIYDGAEFVNRLAELVRPNGQRVIVGASGTLIRKFDPETNQWATIGSGYEPGIRWQTEPINGYLCLNNTVDLPCYYQIQNATVLPLYELREVGIASVGRIAEYNGFLFLGDVTEIIDDQLATFMQGYANFVGAGPDAKVASFTVSGPEWIAGTQYNVTTGAANMVATLPAAVPAVPSSPGGYFAIIKKVDAGAGAITTLPLIGNQAITLVNLNDTALIFSDGITYSAKYFPGGVIPATMPYGLVPADIAEEHPDEQAWGTIGDPTNWAVELSLYLPAASDTLTLPYVPADWVAGQTLVGVVGAGPAEGTLGGQSNTPNGVLITAIIGNQVTLAETTDPGITYPTTASILRFSDIGAYSGNYSYGDGRRIRGMRKLQGTLVSCRDGSLDIIRFLADTTTPFSFRNKYAGENVPGWGDCIVSVNGDFLLYPTAKRNFYGFDGYNEPMVNAVCDDSKDLFFGPLTSEFQPWAIENPLATEVWFMRDGGAMAYDYQFGTTSEIDTQIDAACFCQQPNSTDKWFVLGIDQQAGGSNVYTYALTPNAAQPVVSFFRDGANPGAILKSGLMWMGDPVNEKTLMSYTPVLGSPSPDCQVTIDLFTTYNPSAAPVQIMNPSQILPDPQGNNFFTTEYQAIYFQDRISITDARNIDVRLTQRLMEYKRVGASGVTRQSAG